MEDGGKRRRDPTRALELLWGVGVDSTRGPKPGLTVDEIVESALAIAEMDGLQGLSMRRVAERLEVGTASLYTYVPGKDELLALMLDAAVATDRLPHEYPGDWRAKTEAWARADWHEYRSHPWALQLASVPPLLGPNLARWMDSALSVLAETGLSEGEIASAVQSIDAFVRGHAGMTAITDTADIQGWRAAQEGFVAQHLDLAEFPSFAGASAKGRFADPKATFEAGLAWLLDGIQATMTSRGRG